jgi:DNA helicase-2/ATP-dependent DNA helicase PcrA
MTTGVKKENPPKDGVKGLETSKDKAQETFLKAYKSLNTAQKQAVDTIEGPVMVIAGPGTGKTQILTLRIGNILLSTDTTPDSILALTFTESGVQAMRKRLVSTIGETGYKVHINTFHGFCNEIIAHHPDDFPRIIGSKSTSDIDAIRILQDIISETKLEFLKPYGDTFFYVRPILSEIKDIKRENINPEQFAELVKEQKKNFEATPDLYHEKGAHKGKMKGVHADREKKIKKNEELAIVFKKYEEALTSKRLFDYEDMIMEVIRVLESNEPLRLEIQERYQYVLADEHQDANNAQNKILELITSFHENPNLFIVGDEKQAIFRFQGASLANFLYFKKLYPDALVINLENNYRSTQTILDGSHSIISHNSVKDAKLRVKLQAALDIHKGKTVAPIELYEFSKTDLELAFLVYDIKEKIKTGTKAGEIAVIYRDNKDAFPVISVLEKTAIPFVVHSDRDVLSDEAIRKLILLFRAVSEPGNEEAFVRMLHVDFLDLDAIAIFKLCEAARAKRISVFDVIHNNEKLQEFYKKYTLWARRAKNINITEIFEELVRESGMLGQILSSSGSLDTLNKVESFFAFARQMLETNPHTKLKEFLEHLDVLDSFNVRIKASASGLSQDGVHLMTAHKSKGLEFEHVYIIGGYDKHWSNKRDITYFESPIPMLAPEGEDKIEDERRLFYVALTRAKKRAVITFAKEGTDGREQLPTQFIGEIAPEFISSHATFELEALLTKESRAKAFQPKVQHGIELTNKEYLQHLFLEQGLSVSALNNYLKCPWNFFFNNLLRIPKAYTKHQMYGNAVHAALYAFFTEYKENKNPSKAFLVGAFESSLSSMPLSDNDLYDSLEKGKKALSGYFNLYHEAWPKDILLEYSISKVLLSFEAGGEQKTLELRGKLDKVERINDTEVHVVDYKTAEPKSRNELMGKTKTATGDYFRQLIFYKLLLEGHNKEQFKFASADIDFIEPDKTGNYRKERFEISDDEVTELKNLIRQSANEIFEVSFWEKRCGEKDCEYCALRNVMKSES